MKIVKEDINFERGQDPKKSMDIGHTKSRERFLNLFPRWMSDGEFLSKEKGEIYKKVRKIILTKAIVKFYKYEEDGEQYVSVEFPESEYNFFIFRCIMSLFDSYSPKNVRESDNWTKHDNKLELVVNENN